MIQLIQRSGFVAIDQLFIGFIDVTIKSMLLVLAAAIACSLMQRSSSSNRNFIWRTALVGLSILPALGLFLPGTALPLQNLTVKERTSTAKAAVTELRKPESIATTSGQAQNDIVECAQSGSQPVRAIPYRQLIKQAVVTSSVSTDLVRNLILLWFVGASLCAVRLLGSIHELTLLQRVMERLTAGREFDMLSDCCAKTGIQSTVLLYAGENGAAITAPLTWGARRPIIVLPSGFAGWSNDRLRSALLHELGHIARSDWNSQIFAALLCCFYWYNPLCWLVARKMRDECEAASDDFVIGAGVSPVDYASQLLELACMSRGNAPVFAIAMSRKCALEPRLKAILSPKASRSKVTAPNALAFAVISSIVILGLAHYRYCYAAGTVPSQPAILQVGSLHQDTDSSQSLGDGDDAVVASKPDAVVTLYNQAQVKVVAVTDSQNASIGGWSPVNGVLSVPAGAVVDRLNFKRLGAGLKGRTVFFTIAAPSYYSSTYSSKSDHPHPRSTAESKAEYALTVRQFNSWYSSFYSDYQLRGPSVIYQYIPNHRLSAEYPTLSSIVLTPNKVRASLAYSEPFDSASELARVRLAVATGPFIDIVEFSKEPLQTVTSSGRVFTLRLTKPQGHTGRSEIDVTDPLAVHHSAKAFTDFDRKILCVGSHGEHLGIYQMAFRSWTPDLKFTDSASVPDKVMAKTSSIVFVARPYDWVEFDNVRLDPNTLQHHGQNGTKKVKP